MMFNIHHLFVVVIGIALGSVASFSQFDWHLRKSKRRCTDSGAPAARAQTQLPMVYLFRGEVHLHRTAHQFITSHIESSWASVRMDTHHSITSPSLLLY